MLHVVSARLCVLIPMFAGGGGGRGVACCMQCPPLALSQDRRAAAVLGWSHGVGPPRLAEFVFAPCQNVT